MGHTLSRLMPKTRNEQTTQGELPHQVLARRPSTPPQHHAHLLKDGQQTDQFVETPSQPQTPGPHIHFRTPVYATGLTPPRAR